MPTPRDNERLRQVISADRDATTSDNHALDSYTYSTTMGLGTPVWSTTNAWNGFYKPSSIAKTIQEAPGGLDMINFDVRTLKGSKFKVIKTGIYYIKGSVISMDCDEVKAYFLEHCPVDGLLDDSMEDYVDEDIIELAGLKIIEVARKIASFKIRDIYEELI